MLKKRGYATAHIGKWHLGGKGFEPSEQGFDVNIARRRTGSPRKLLRPVRATRPASMPGLEKAADGRVPHRPARPPRPRSSSRRTEIEPFFLYLPHYAVHIAAAGEAGDGREVPKATGRPAGRATRSTRRWSRAWTTASAGSSRSSTT